MIAYFIKYKTNSDNIYSMHVDAKNIKSAKKKIENKTKQKITIFDLSVIGYY